MKYFRSIFSILFFSSLFIFPAQAQTDSITDLDGNVYQTIAIGTQWWMAENLKVTKYSNGDSIPYLKQADDWAIAEAGAYCFYANRSTFIDMYGMLYNWYTASDERGVCPAGWHVSTDEDWITLEKYLGMSEAETERMTAWRGTDEGNKLKDESFEGNNSSGFTALATGYRDPEGVFKAMGTDNDYWTSTPYDNQGNTEGVLHGLLNSKSTVVRNFHVPGYGFCIRCVKDDPVGIKNKKTESGMQVFPNPAVDQLYVRNATGNQLTIRNLAGQVVLDEELSSQKHLVDMSGLCGGTYLVSITGLEETLTTRVIIL